MTRHSSAALPGGKPSRLVRVRRKPDRARYDMPAVHAVLDAAPFCHVATIRAIQVTEPGEILAGLQAMVDHLAPGRWEQVRKPSAEELRETALWQVPIDAASVKSRSGSTLDPEDDRALPVWAGHIPAQLVFGEPVPADGLPPGIRLPGCLRALPAAIHPADPRAIPASEPGANR